MSNSADYRLEDENQTRGRPPGPRSRTINYQTVKNKLPDPNFGGGVPFRG